MTEQQAIYATVKSNREEDTTLPSATSIEELLKEQIELLAEWNNEHVECDAYIEQIRKNAETIAYLFTTL